MSVTTEDCLKIKPVKSLSKVREVLRSLPSGTTLTPSLEAVLSTETEKEVCLGVQDLQFLRTVCKDNGIKVSIHEILEESEIVVPAPKFPPRNPILEKRIQALKFAEENRAYRRMTKNVDPRRVREPEESIGYQLRQVNKQLIAVAQFIMSVGAGFTFGFLGVELLLQRNFEFGFRLLLGVMCGLIIALAEIYFLAKKLSEDMFPPSMEELDAQMRQTCDTDVKQNPPDVPTSMESETVLTNSPNIIEEDVEDKFIDAEDSFENGKPHQS